MRQFIASALLVIALTGCATTVTKEVRKKSDSVQGIENPTDETPATVAPQQGDPAHSGGSPTVRKSFTPLPDDPTTTNNESNDQPLGHFGKATITVHNVSSGNTYDLDADVEAGQVKRLYFAKGGWVDMDSGDIDDDGHGSGTDEQGKEWEFEGYVSPPAGSNSSAPMAEQEDN